MISPVFVLLSVLPALVSAANDWSVPCFQGVCAYDIKQDENDMPATMVIVSWIISEHTPRVANRCAYW